MFCKNCGKKIDDDSRFCMYCGTQFIIQETENEGLCHLEDDLDKSIENEIYISDEAEKIYNKNGGIQERRENALFWNAKFRSKESKKMIKKYEILGNEVIFDKGYVQKKVLTQEYNELLERLWNNAKAQYEVIVVAGNEDKLELYIEWFANTTNKILREALALVTKIDIKLTEEETCYKLQREAQEGEQMQEIINSCMADVEQGAQFFTRNYLMIIGVGEVENGLLQYTNNSSNIIAGGEGIKGALAGFLVGQTLNYLIVKSKQIRQQRIISERQKLALSKLVCSEDTMKILEHTVKQWGKAIQVICLQAAEEQDTVELFNPEVTINGTNYLNISEKELRENPVVLGVLGTLLSPKSKEMFDFLWECCDGTKTEGIEEYFKDFQMTSVLNKKYTEIYE